MASLCLEPSPWRQQVSFLPSLLIISQTVEQVHPGHKRFIICGEHWVYLLYMKQSARHKEKPKQVHPQTTWCVAKAGWEQRTRCWDTNRLYWLLHRKWPRTAEKTSEDEIWSKIILFHLLLIQKKKKTKQHNCTILALSLSKLPYAFDSTYSSQRGVFIS